MLGYILNWTEGCVTFAFLFLTLTKTYQPKKNVMSAHIKTFLWIFLFSILFKPIEIFHPGLFTYLAFILFFSITGSLLFFEKGLPNKLTVIITYVSTIISLKVCILMVFHVYGLNAFDNDLLNLRNYFIYYGLLWLLSIFIVKYPIFFSKQLPNQYWLLMVICPLIAGTSSLINLNLNINTGDFSPSALNISASLCILVLIIYYLTHLMSSTYEKLLITNHISQRQQLEIEYLKHTSTMISMVRQEKHELKNNYFYISSLLKEKKYDELESYLENNLNYKFSAMEEFQTGDKLLDLLLTQKVSEARKNHIRVVTNILLPAQITIDRNELCSLLLNLWDNAIDASKKIDGGDIHFSITHSKGYLNIKIKNKVNENILEKNSMLLTTKKNKAHHGIGMKIMRSIVKKNNGILKIYMDTIYFIVEIMLPV